MLVGWVQTSSVPFWFLQKKKEKIVGKCSVQFGVEIYIVPSQSFFGGFIQLKANSDWVCRHSEFAPAPPDQQLLFAICLTRRYVIKMDRPNLKILKVIECEPDESATIVIESD